MSGAFLGIWNDLAGDEADYAAWITREHMAERMGAPGFLEGRRYIRLAGDSQRFLNLYLGAELATFASPAYRAMLDNPTPLTRQMMPRISNVTRMAFRTVLRHGGPAGGTLLALRWTASRAEADALAAALDGWWDAHPAICALRLGVAEAATTAQETSERRLRGGGPESDGSHALLVEFVEEAAASALAGMIRDRVAGATGGLRHGLYRLSCLLGPMRAA